MADFMLHIFKVNVLSAVVIFIVLAASKLLDKKYSPRWRYVIWLIISVFLLVPVQPPSNSKSLIIEVPRQITRSDISMDTNTAVTENPNIPADNAQNSKPLTGIPIKTNTQDTTGLNSKNSDSSMRNITMNTIAQMMAIIWGAGICLAAVCKIFMMRTGKLILHRWRIPVTDSKRIAQYKKLCREMHIKKAPKLMTNSRLSGPLLAGIRNTYLYLPTGDYTRDEYELIFRHELCHYRSKDLWYKMLMICVTIVYWFNPAVYFMKKEAERDIEFICDESVIKDRSREDKLRYNRLLLKTAALDRHPYELSTSLNDGLLTFKKRMVNIMKAGNMKRGIFPIICFTVILIMSNILTGCSLKDSDEKQKKADTETSVDNDASKEEDKPSDKEDEDESETVLKGSTNTGSKENADTKDQSEQSESTQKAQQNQNQTNQEESRTELSGYMSKDSLPTIVQNLGLSQGESTLFGDSGIHYEGNGIRVEWHSQSVGEDGFTPITVTCESNSSVSMKGVYCGKEYKEAESSLLQNGYRNLGSSSTHKEYISDADNEIMTLDVSGESVSAWSWLNWPQGDFSPATTQYMPADGDYSNTSDTGEYATIRISGINESSFYFSIYKNVEGQGEDQIFMDNIAVFEDTGSSTAVFRGQQYTLTFDCSESGAIRLSGFEEATALGDTFRQ